MRMVSTTLTMMQVTIGKKNVLLPRRITISPGNFPKSGRFPSAMSKTPTRAMMTAKSTRSFPKLLRSNGDMRIHLLFVRSSDRAVCKQRVVFFFLLTCIYERNERRLYTLSLGYVAQVIKDDGTGIRYRSSHNIEHP